MLRTHIEQNHRLKRNFIYIYLEYSEDNETAKPSQASMFVGIN